MYNTLLINNDAIKENEEGKKKMKAIKALQGKGIMRVTCIYAYIYIRTFVLLLHEHQIDLFESVKCVQCLCDGGDARYGVQRK